MSHPASSDSEAVASTALDEKAPPAVNEKHSAEPDTHISALTDLQIFDIDAVELPDGYFRSSFFIGTVAATGLAIMSGVGIFGTIAPLLGVINEDLGPDPSYTWIGLVYILTLGLGQLFCGRFSDLFGRRWFFIGASALSLIGCIVSATAKTIPTLIGATVLVGFAASGQQSYTYVLTEIVPMKWRFYASSWIYLCCVPWSGFGPAIAYGLVQHSKHTWRSCYYVFIGINVLTILCFFFFYHPPNFNDKWTDRKTRMQVIKDFDYVGLILGTGGIVVFCIGVSWGGSYYPWKSVHVITTILVGFFALVAFALYEAIVNLKEPLMPMRLFKNIGWVGSIWMLACAASVYFAFSIVWPIMVFGLYTSNQTKGGLLCCVTGLGTNMGQIFSGIAAKGIGRQKYQAIFATTAMMIILASAAVETPYNQSTVAALLFFGLFFSGWADGLGLTIASIEIPDQTEIGTAMGVASIVRQVVSTIASTIYTTVLTNRLNSTIPKEVPPKLIAAGLPASSVASFLGAVTVGTQEAFSKVVGLTSEIEAIGIAAYKVANADAYRTVMLTTIAFSALSVLGAVAVPHVDKYMTGTVVAALHTDKDEEKAVAQE